MPQRRSFSDKCADLLTTREQEILRLVGKGLSSKEIASDLFLSLHTVSTHRKSICQKLEIHSAAELIAFAATRIAE